MQSVLIGVYSFSAIPYIDLNLNLLLAYILTLSESYLYDLNPVYSQKNTLFSPKPYMSSSWLVGGWLVGWVQIPPPTNQISTINWV